ncbi:MAG: LytTR family transcriptional regulator DNA-binding domain-containing protein [Clostridia bacterium]|nr:LytTR family transcriptional regulator DNA-binding domain-containing protein [Clostridia bacterium]
MKTTEKSDHMDEINDIVKNFIEQYGVIGLKQALKNYAQTNHSYIICTKESVTKIKIDEIYYLEIEGHHIHVHTEKEKYRKYGTLNKELETLSGFRFMKCHQSYVVSVFCKPFLDKIAKYFWTLLQVHFGQSCKALASLK